jgi:hypothetical protein
LQSVLKPDHNAIAGESDLLSKVLLPYIGSSAAASLRRLP